MSLKQQPKHRAWLAHHIKPHKNNEGERGRAMSMKLDVTYEGERGVFQYQEKSAGNRKGWELKLQALGFKKS